MITEHSSKAYRRKLEKEINRLYRDIDTKHSDGREHPKVRKFEASPFPHQWTPNPNN